MKLNQMSYSHELSGWEIKDVTFPQLCLFVGLSGVGKTRILRAIQCLKEIAKGGVADGVQWSIKFIVDDDLYEWSGRYESLGHRFREIIGIEDAADKTKRPNLVSEEIICNGVSIASRSQEGVVFRGNKTPKLSPEVSLIKLFQQEDVIAPISKAFSRVHFVDGTGMSGDFFFEHVIDEEDCDKGGVKSIEDLKAKDVSVFAKLAIACELELPAFNQLKEDFMDVFPFVSDLSVGVWEAPDAPRYFQEVRIIKFKEEGSGEWIPFYKMSSGMRKTFEQLAMVAFYPDHSVFMIDEFENSLGANCVDFVTDSIMEAADNSQFILTSHHPIVVNNIGMEHWRIVKREIGRVQVSSAPELGIGESRHEQYAQLMNSLLF